MFITRESTIFSNGKCVHEPYLPVWDYTWAGKVMVKRSLACKKSCFHSLHYCFYKGHDHFHATKTQRNHKKQSFVDF